MEIVRSVERERRKGKAGHPSKHRKEPRFEADEEGVVVKGHIRYTETGEGRKLGEDLVGFSGQEVWRQEP